MRQSLKWSAATAVIVIAMIASVRGLCRRYFPANIENPSSPREQQEPVGWVFGRMIGVSPHLVPRPGQVQSWGPKHLPSPGEMATAPRK